MCAGGCGPPSLPTVFLASCTMNSKTKTIKDNKPIVHPYIFQLTDFIICIDNILIYIVTYRAVFRLDETPLSRIKCFIAVKNIPAMLNAEFIQNLSIWSELKFDGHLDLWPLFHAIIISPFFVVKAADVWPLKKRHGFKPRLTVFKDDYFLQRTHRILNHENCGG